MIKETWEDVPQEIHTWKVFNHPEYSLEIGLNDGRLPKVRFLWNTEKDCPEGELILNHFQLMKELDAIISTFMCEDGNNDACEWSWYVKEGHFTDEEVGDKKAEFMMVYITGYVLDYMS